MELPTLPQRTGCRRLTIPPCYPQVYQNLQPSHTLKKYVELESLVTTLKPVISSKEQPLNLQGPVEAYFIVQNLWPRNLYTTLKAKCWIRLEKAKWFGRVIVLGGICDPTFPKIKNQHFFKFRVRELTKSWSQQLYFPQSQRTQNRAKLIKYLI